MPKTPNTLPRVLEDWDGIRFFLAIHRAGSLSAAAATLGVTQPTCGRRLSALESAVGAQLFMRAPDGLRPTAEGTALLVAATQMEDAARNVALRAAATVAKLDGVVRIAMTELTALALGARALPILRERYPGIDIELVLADTPADILGREADVAIRWGPESFRPSPAKLVARKLGRVAWCLFGSDRYIALRGTPPRDGSDLDAHHVVVYPGASYPAAEWFTKARRNAVTAFTSANIVCNASGVNEGIGVGFFPKMVLRLHPSLRQLTNPIAWGWAWLVMHPDLRAVPRIRAVADVLTAHVRSDLEMLEN